MSAPVSTPAQTAPAIVYHDPGQLEPHPLLLAMPMWSDGDSRMKLLRQDIQGNGIIEPLKITKGLQIVDGRHRWRAARILQLEAVPCVVVPDDQVATLAVSTLLARRHFTAGQRAYLAYPFFAPAHQEAHARRIENLQKGQLISVADSIGNGPPKTVAEIAERLGVSRDTFQQAAKLHNLFKKPAIKAEWEPKILSEDDPIGLGACIAGIAGQAATTDVTPEKKGRLPRVVTAAGHWLAAFQAADAEAIRASREAMAQNIGFMTPDAAATLAEELEVAAKLARARAGKKAKGGAQ